MSKSIKAFVVIGLAAFVAACGAAEPETVAEPEPIMAEPAMDKM
jgi:hypothetical protein